MTGTGKFRIAVTTCAALAVVVVAQGCAQRTSAPEPQQPQFRPSAETAPAALQLACAEEATQAYEVSARRVLPIASSADEAGAYRVVLNADGTQVVCTVDDDGNVLSLVEA
jgi:hypothetical protein